MQRLIAALMLINAALFLFGAVQHAGIAIGPFSEPVIHPAMIVESICAIALMWGALRSSTTSILIGNGVAIAGVVLGMIALAAGRGPRTASNDLNHRFMLVLAVAAIVIAWMRRRVART